MKIMRLLNLQIRTEAVINQIQAHHLDASLLEAAEKTGRTPMSGDVKMIYFTRAGPGPQSLPMSEANLDPTTGLNTYHP